MHIGQSLHKLNSSKTVLLNSINTLIEIKAFIPSYIPNALKSSSCHLDFSVTYSKIRSFVVHCIHLVDYHPPVSCQLSYHSTVSINSSSVLNSQICELSNPWNLFNCFFPFHSYGHYPNSNNIPLLHGLMTLNLPLIHPIHCIFLKYIYDFSISMFIKLSVFLIVYSCIFQIVVLITFGDTKDDFRWRVLFCCYFKSFVLIVICIRKNIARTSNLWFHGILLRMKLSKNTESI